jgi:hypothetical protein
MKPVIFFCISFLLLKSNSFAQDNSTNKNVDILNIKLTVFKNSKEGRTFKTYHFNNKKIHIYDKPFPTNNYKEHLYTKHKYNSKELFLELSKLNLYSLKKEYNNNYIDSNNGKDYFIIITSKTNTTSTNLHHYYIKEIEEFMTLLNRYLPQTLQILYLNKETKQDCSNFK